MTRIFYSLAGEGLGHASRTLSVIDDLPEEEVHVYTFGKAYEYLEKQNYPYLHKIDGLMFPYKNGKVNYTRLSYRILKHYFSGLKKNIDQITKDAQELKPEIFVCDFEPSLPRAAKNLRKTLISVDNQHRFSYCDLSDLPWNLRLYARLVGISTRMLVPKPDEVVISTFHSDTIKTTRPNVHLTSGLMRKEIIETPATNDGSTLVYVRESVSDKILFPIYQYVMENYPETQEKKFKIYGAPNTRMKWIAPPTGFEFKPLGPEFMKDLASCNKVISTAGNQLISECRFYQKPILVIPEPGQHEQSINGYYVEKTGLGISCDANKFNHEVVKSFLNDFKSEASTQSNGVYKVTEVIRRHL